MMLWLLRLVALWTVTTLLAGCNSLPYRVEWGWGKQGENGTTQFAGLPPDASPLTRWVAWETAHEDLTRRMTHRRGGERFPHSILERCRESLADLHRHVPPPEAAVSRETESEVAPGAEASDESPLERADRYYARLGELGSRVDSTRATGLLDRVRDLVESVRE